MSLNGLDNDAVTQAHQTALAEAGGWLLLKYANRDTIELLAKGSGGVSEARSAVERYEEKSPLYGLVQYRRRKVILKYVPEGTSRLLQVRLAVQFQSILDTFIPHDTVFSFTAANELTDSTLGLCTMKLQHPASNTSSSSSLRQRRLNEIVEDAEEGTTSEVTAASPIMRTRNPIGSYRSEDTSTLPASAVRAKALLAQRKQEDAREEQGSETPINTIEHKIEKESSTQLKPNPYDGPVSPLTDTYGPVLETIASPDSETTLPKISIAISRPSFDFPIPDPASDSDDDVRRPIPKEHPAGHYSNHLSAAESSSISRWTDEVVASTKKQKRAPRPHVDNQIGPRTSGHTDDDDAEPSRRIAILPTSVRVSSRISYQPSRPGSQQSTRSVPARYAPPASLPPPMPSSTFPLLPVSLQQSRPSPSQASSTANESSSATPEKMRLMKALQMRKRNQLLALRSASHASSTPVPFTSIDSSRSGASDSPTAPSASMSSFSAVPEAAFTGQELGSINESETTSPTSVITASDNHSTKPSSLSETSVRRPSQTSLASDTNSSTTPKANTESKLQKTSGPERPSANEDRTDAIPVALVPQIVSSPVEIEQNGAENLLPQPLSESAKEVVGDPALEDRGRTVKETLRAGSNKSLSPLPRGKKRYHFEGSIRIPPSMQGSDVSDDESLMEELQNATVHEAKPVSVNRTPVTPVLQKTPTRELQPSQVTATTPRSVSAESQTSTSDRRRTASGAGSTRSLATALPQWPPPSTEPVPALPKQKPTVGSNISKRIKALEGLSQRDNNASAVPVKESTPRASGFSTILKRTSFLASLSNVDAIPEKVSSRTASSPLRAEFGIEANQASLRSTAQRQGTSTEVYSPSHKRESVTVTARIVRDPLESAHGTSDSTRNMHRSPLIVERGTSHDTDARHPMPRVLMTQSTGSAVNSPNSERRRFSFSSHRSGAQMLSPTELKSHRLSYSSYQKKASKAPSETSSVTEDKRTSRTSRMLKRLSGLGKPRNAREQMSSPTRDTAQPKTIQEQAEMESDIRHVVDIGEVNVQFPETPLWKRRLLRVDDQGYLIFAPPLNDHTSRGRSRKLHLDEFTGPSLPDMEREQMAWSIVLDLKDGRCVQCACESREAQRSTLKLLTDAHSAYHQLYPSS